MSSLVLDLQQELLKSDCDVLSALRKAKVIATKLYLSDFDIWIKKELNGYELEDNIPEYRIIRGSLRAYNPYRGWIPVITSNDEWEKILCARNIYQPISELVQLTKNENTNTPLSISYSGEQQAVLNRLCNNRINTEFNVFIGQNSITAIIEAVKNCLLEWTLKLEEEGVLGENMRFTDEETQSAKGIPQQVNNYYGNVVSGNISDSQFAGDNSPITIINNNGIDINEFDKLTKAITDNISSLGDDNQETIIGAIEILRDEIVKAQPKKSVLSSGIKLLAPFVAVANGIPILVENIQKLIEYIQHLPPMLP